jgi:hypothetical protein
MNYPAASSGVSKAFRSKQRGINPKGLKDHNNLKRFSDRIYNSQAIQYAEYNVNTGCEDLTRGGCSRMGKARAPF